MVIFESILALILLIFMYYLPSIIAISKKHSKVMQITLVNVLSGWTFIGWIIAFIWAVTTEK